MSLKQPEPPAPSPPASVRSPRAPTCTARPPQGPDGSEGLPQLRGAGSHVRQVTTGAGVTPSSSSRGARSSSVSPGRSPSPGTRGPCGGRTASQEGRGAESESRARSSAAQPGAPSSSHPDDATGPAIEAPAPADKRVGTPPRIGSVSSRRGGLAAVRAASRRWISRASSRLARRPRAPAPRVPVPSVRPEAGGQRPGRSRRRWDGRRSPDARERKDALPSRSVPAPATTTRRDGKHESARCGSREAATHGIECGRREGLATP